MTAVVVDTSAAVAILLSEPQAEPLLVAFDRADERLMSAATFVELGAVLEAKLHPAGAGIADRFVEEGGVEVVPFDQHQAARALEGWRRFGKGRHRAALDFGDCFTYGLAVALDRPVLCVGDDFARTDVEVVPLGA